MYEAEIRVLEQQNIEYVLIKYAYLVKKEMNDLDVLVKESHYKKTIKAFRKEKYYVVYGEGKEKYKTLMRNTSGKKVHVHRRIAWNGIVALDEKKVLRRKRRVEKKNVPSIEDEYLIHAAHIVFELEKARPYEKKIFKQLRKEKLDKKYLRKQLTTHHWSAAFEKAVAGKRVSKADQLPKLVREPKTAFYAVGHYLKHYLKPEKGQLLVLLGPDGSGKSTIAKELKRYGYTTVYGGWKNHMLPTSKLLVKYGARMKKSVAPGTKKSVVKQPGMIKELVYANYYLEHLARYAKARWHNRRGKPVVFDRHFLDIYLQDPALSRTRIAKHLFKKFPKADTYVHLYASPAELVKRKPDENTIKKVREQQARINALAKQYAIKTVKSAKEVRQTVKELVEEAL